MTTKKQSTPKAPKTQAAEQTGTEQTTEQTPAVKAKVTRKLLRPAIRYEVMTAVRERYVDSGLTDSEFAEQASAQFGSDVSVAVIKSAREAFGIAPTKQATAAELKARIAELEAELAANGTPEQV